MTRKKPLAPKRRHYSRDLKRRIVYQAEVLGCKSIEISINLDISLRVVQRVKQTWNEIGEVCRDRTAVGRAPIMHPEHCKFLLTLLEHSPDLYLDELQEQLEEQHNIKVSISTISNTLKRLGITSKKLSRMASERCEASRREFGFEIGQYPAEYLVCGDEAAVNLLTTYRTNGWNSRKLRACKSCCFIRGARYSMLPAITLDGIIYSHIKEGSYNGDQFLEWLDGLLRVMNPYPAPHSVLILDNCRIHHVEGVEE